MKDNTNLNKEIGSKIRYYRNKKNITQQGLAERVGISWEMISRYERGNSAAFKNLTKICDALGINSKDVFTKDDEAYTYSAKIPIIELEKDSNQILFKKTMLSYSCPDWLILEDKDCFALALGTNIKCTLLEPNKNIIFFISTNKKPKSHNLVLYFSDGKLNIAPLTDYNKGKNKHEYVGVILGYDVKCE